MCRSECRSPQSGHLGRRFRRRWTDPRWQVSIRRPAWTTRSRPARRITRARFPRDCGRPRPARESARTSSLAGVRKARPSRPQPFGTRERGDDGRGTACLRNQSHQVAEPGGAAPKPAWRTASRIAAAVRVAATVPMIVSAHEVAGPRPYGGCRPAWAVDMAGPSRRARGVIVCRAGGTPRGAHNRIGGNRPWPRFAAGVVWTCTRRRWSR
jgi:hypothetical protein